MSNRQLFLTILGVSLWAMGVRETLDPDMWWHLRTGEAILHQGIPRHDIFSFTVPQQPWITHEWLAQLGLWLVYILAGLPGLMLLFAGVAWLVFWLVYAASEERPFLPALLTLWAAIASAIVWGVRPQMFNLLLGASFVFLLEKVRQRQLAARWLWLLPPLTLLWANLHSGYLFGVVLVAVFTVGEAVQQGWQHQAPQGMPPSTIRQLALIVLLSFLAAAVNPNGTAIWVYPFLTLTSSAMQAYILEWHPPSWQTAVYWPFFGLVLLGFVGLAGSLWRGKRPFFSDLLLFGGTAVAGFVSARHIPLFAIVAVPTLVRWLRPFWPTITPATPNRWLSRLNMLVAVVVVLAAVGWAATKINNNETAIAQRYPVAAVTFLEENGLSRARGYNSYNWGGYLIWRGLPVFVDGRADVYGDDFLFDYRKTFAGQVGWERPLGAYDVRYVLIEPNSRLSHQLTNSPNWQLVYRDTVAQVFVRAP